MSESVQCEHVLYGTVLLSGLESESEITTQNGKSHLLLASQ